MAFIPRKVFEVTANLPKTYFLGHHKAGLNDMRKMVKNVDLVMECRDFRIPATSINPAFEEAIGETRRWIIYTKRDRGGDLKLENQKKEKTIERWNRDCPVYFMSKMNRVYCMPLIKALKKEERPPSGLRIMVVGMPNVGKSTLINSLRAASIKVGKKAAAPVGDQPGVTRSIGGPIKLVDGGTKPSIYVYDTPGAFVPYMPDAEAMLKLALCTVVKRDIIPSYIILADYLLYQINKWRPTAYQGYVRTPTNDIDEFLEVYGRRISCLGKGGVVDKEAAARRFVSWYDQEKFGAFMFDDPYAYAEENNKRLMEKYGGSLTEAWKKKKAEVREARAIKMKAEKEAYAALKGKL